MTASKKKEVHTIETKELAEELNDKVAQGNISIEDVNEAGRETQNSNMDDSITPLKAIPDKVSHIEIVTNPKAKNNDDDDPELDILLEEVQFDKDASIAECFQSALKCWRIYNPNVIVVE